MTRTRSGAIRGKALRRIVVGQIMPAVGAVEVGHADAFVAYPAVWRDAIRALRAIVKIAIHFGTAAGALRKYRLAQKKIQHRTDPALQNNAQQNPEPFAHIPAWRVLADIADHQHVDRDQRTPRRPEINVHGEWAVVVGMQDKEEKILDANKCHKG